MVDPKSRACRWNAAKVSCSILYTACLCTCQMEALASVASLT